MGSQARRDVQLSETGNFPGFVGCVQTVWWPLPLLVEEIQPSAFSAAFTSFALNGPRLSVLPTVLAVGA